MSTNQPLATTIYRPNGVPRAIVQIVHGMMEHRKRYDYFAKALCSAGFVVITYDQRGHGESAASQSELGYFADERGWKLLIADCFEINQMIKKEYPDLSCILFGHSMGAIVARSFLKRYDTEINGMILSGAPCYNKMIPMGHNLAKVITVAKGRRKYSPMLHNLVVGTFNKKFPEAKTPSDWISKNEENVTEYLNDPFCQFKFTNQAYLDLMFGVRDMHDLVRWNLKNPKLPILFISGEEDPCTGGKEGLNQSVKTLKEAGYTNIERRVYATLRHEILNEKEKDKVIDDVIKWCNKNLAD